jgi:hypothetical protein
VKTSIAFLGAAVLAAGCATRQLPQPQPAPYVPAALVNPPPKPIEVPPDPMVARPLNIQLLVCQRMRPRRFAAIGPILHERYRAFARLVDVHAPASSVAFE